MQKRGEMLHLPAIERKIVSQSWDSMMRYGSLAASLRLPESTISSQGVPSTLFHLQSSRAGSNLLPIDRRKDAIFVQALTVYNRRKEGKGEALNQ
jgi:hypothetical protein